MNDHLTGDSRFKFRTLEEASRIQNSLADSNARFKFRTLEKPSCIQNTVFLDKDTPTIVVSPIAYKKWLGKLSPIPPSHNRDDTKTSLSHTNVLWYVDSSKLLDFQT